MDNIELNNGKEQVKDDKLTPKQLMFAEYYVATNNAVESAKRAGYTGSGISVTASRLLHNPKIERKISELRQEELKKIQFDKSDTIAWIIDMANPVNEYKYNPNHRLKALELLGKAQGLFIERKEITSESVVSVHNPSNLTDEQLDQLLGEYEGEDDTALIILDDETQDSE